MLVAELACSLFRAPVARFRLVVFAGCGSKEIVGSFGREENRFADQLGQAKSPEKDAPTTGKELVSDQESHQKQRKPRPRLGKK